MTTELEAARVVRSWLQTERQESADRILGIVLERLETLPQRPSLAQTWRTHLSSRTSAFVAATLALLLVAGIGVAAFLSRPAVGPGATPSPSPTAVVSPAPSASPGPSASAGPSASPAARHVVYLASKTLEIDAHNRYVYKRIWIANADGSNPHELLVDPSVVGAEPANQGIVGWLPDGSELVYTEGWSEGTVGLFMIDPDGGEPRLICSASDCLLTASGDISPDGRALAFASPDGIAVLDLASGQVDALDIPAAGGAEPCDPNAHAVWGGPTWSEDGAQLQFASGFWSLERDFCGLVVLEVNADGSDLRILAADTPVNLDPNSSDGRYLQPVPEATP
jgi:hypothetical protein